MTRRRRTFGVTNPEHLDDTPRRVLIDTTVIVDAFVETQPRHRVIRALVDRLAVANTMLVTSRLIDLELPQALTYVAARDLGLSPKAAADDRRIRRRAHEMTTRINDQWQRLLLSTQRLRVEVAEIADAIPAVMLATGLRSSDAAMAASAVLVGCDAVATTDLHFGRLSERDVPTLITVTERVRGMRALRAAARPI